MYRALLCPSSGAHDYSADYHMAIAIACNPDTYPACLHLTSNQQQPKNRTAHVVISIIVVSSWWWAYQCPKHVETIISIIKQ